MAFTYDLVVFSRLNTAPQIVSVPTVEAVAERNYFYLPQGFDPDVGDELHYSLLIAPWMEEGSGPIDFSDLLVWTPTRDNIGNHIVSIRVADSYGAANDQTFILKVIDPETAGNRPPSILSAPIVEARVNTAYEYQVRAYDPELGTLSFSLGDEIPDGKDGPMAISGFSEGDYEPVYGIVTWTPLPEQVGTIQWVTIKVSDDQDQSAYQTYGVRVLPELGNSPPVFVSSAKENFDLGSKVDYDGKVSPHFITEQGTTITETVSLLGLDGVVGGQLPITDMDVFIIRDQHSSVIDPFGDTALTRSLVLQEALASVIDDLASDKSTTYGFGLGRYQNYAIAGKDPANSTLPFVLSQPVVTANSPILKANQWSLESVLGAAALRNGFAEINAYHTGPNEDPLPTPGYGADYRSLVESLYQIATGQGLDENGNDSTRDNGNAGSASAQNLPSSVITGKVGNQLVTKLSASITNGDVPAFSTFEANNELMLAPPEGDIGGVGFRRNAFPLVIVLQDGRSASSGITSFRYDAEEDEVLQGKDGITVNSDGIFVGTETITNGYTPVIYDNPAYASLQDTTNALVNLGAMVIGIIGHHNPESEEEFDDPTFQISQWDRQVGAFSTLTGAVNEDNVPVRYAYPIDPSYSISTKAEKLSERILQAIQAARKQYESTFDIELIVTDPNVQISSAPAYQSGESLLKNNASVSFDVTITSDAKPHAFDLLFVQRGTGNVLGSIPVKINTVGYDYAAKAIDPDGDSITYSLTSGPTGAAVDEESGALSWVPTSEGSYSFEITASDGRGGIASQKFTVDVDDDRDDNQLPVIQHPVSSDSIATAVGRFLHYQVQATDEDGDALRYYLVRPPSGMKINPTTGLITWQPLAYQIGDRTVNLRVSDGLGGVDTIDFTIKVDERTAMNHRPEFDVPEMPGRTDPPIQFGFHAGGPNKTQFVAHDLDGDPITFDTIVCPIGASIDAETGWLVWTPTATQVGLHQAAVRIRDDHGGAKIVSFTIDVSPENLPPIITSELKITPIANRAFEYQVRRKIPTRATSFTTRSRAHLATWPSMRMAGLPGRLRTPIRRR